MSSSLNHPQPPSPTQSNLKGHGQPEEKFAQSKLVAALFYGISSILVIFTNKWVLLDFQFPYFKFLAMVQFVTTSIILLILSMLKKVDIPRITFPIFCEIMPISCMFLGNVLCGLGSTKSLSIPMFTALRRASILMIMVGEYAILGLKPSKATLISITLMVGGAVIAALYDLSFDLTGYVMVFSNNIFTAMNGVWMKKASLSGKCSKMGLLFYNSLFSAIIMLLYFTAEHQYYSRSGTNSNSNVNSIPVAQISLKADSGFNGVVVADKNHNPQQHPRQPQRLLRSARDEVEWNGYNHSADIQDLYISLPSSTDQSRPLPLHDQQHRFEMLLQDDTAGAGDFLWHTYYSQIKNHAGEMDSTLYTHRGDTATSSSSSNGSNSSASSTGMERSWRTHRRRLIATAGGGNLRASSTTTTTTATTTTADASSKMERSSSTDGALLNVQSSSSSSVGGGGGGGGASIDVQHSTLRSDLARAKNLLNSLSAKEDAAPPTAGNRIDARDSAASTTATTTIATTTKSSASNEHPQLQRSSEQEQKQQQQQQKKDSSNSSSTISQIWQFPGWSNVNFVIMLMVTCCMGSILNYSIFLCTTVNSALTTAVVGTLKNVATTYIGMLVFSDYKFTIVNFIGINISIIGSLYYTYCNLKK